jgi:hypothetical protein
MRPFTLLAALAVGAAALASALAAPAVAASTPTISATDAPTVVTLGAPESVHLYSMFGSSDLADLPLSPTTTALTLVLPDGLVDYLGLPEELSYQVSFAGIEDAGTAIRSGVTVQVPVAESIRAAAVTGEGVEVQVRTTPSAEGVPEQPGSYLRVVDSFEWDASVTETTATLDLASRADAYDVFTFPDSAPATPLAWGGQVAMVLPQGVTWATGSGAWSDLTPTATLYWTSGSGEDAAVQELALADTDVTVSPDGSTITARLPAQAPDTWRSDGAWISVAAQDSTVPRHSIQANVTVALPQAAASGGSGASGALTGVAIGAGIATVLAAVGVLVFLARQRRAMRRR